MRQPPNGRNHQDGFTLIEMIIVGALVIIGAAVAIPVTLQMVASAKGDSALVMTSTFLESARNRAVSERRNIELTFVAPNRIQLVRIEVPSNARTTLAEMMLEGDEEFVRLAGYPDTPDAFGGTGAINFSGTAPVMFTSDGSLIDSAGDVTNGTVFVARPGAPATARAVTISGVTGMLRSWRWGGSTWLQ
jgi:type II secretory pathway pseudopilin PulG